MQPSSSTGSRSGVSRSWATTQADFVRLLGGARSPRIAQIALVSRDAFENPPPGLTVQTLVLAGKLSPCLFELFMQQLRLRPLRRLPLAFGWLTVRGDSVTRRWLTPVLTQRRDPARHGAGPARYRR